MMEASVKTVLLPGRFVADQYQEHLSKAAQLSVAQYEMEHWIIIMSDQRDMIQPGFKKVYVNFIKVSLHQVSDVEVSRSKSPVDTS